MQKQRWVLVAAALASFLVSLVALLEAVEPAPGGEQCFLDEILGVLDGAE